MPIKTLTIVVPALNEEKLIEKTISVAREALLTSKINGEIIIVDDGSTDKTYEISLCLQKKFENIKVVSHAANLGLGAAYKTGVLLSQCEYIMLLPGDDAWDLNEVLKIIKCIGRADVVIPYIKIAGDKSRFRKILSASYTSLINALFSLDVPYYNGIVIHKRALLKKIEIKANDFSYQTEALLKILKLPSTFISVEANTSPRKNGKSKALKINNILSVLKSIAYLYFKLRQDAKK